MHSDRLVAVVLLAATVGCNSDGTLTAPPTRIETTSGDVSATRVPGGIQLTNASAEAVAFFAYNPFLFAQWTSCTDPGPACVRLLRPAQR